MALPAIRTATEGLFSQPAHEIRLVKDCETFPGGDRNSFRSLADNLQPVPRPEFAELEREFLDFGNGRVHHLLRINGVRVLMPESPRLSEQEISDIVTLARGQEMKRVMIADTAPSPEIACLVRALHEAGIEVHFRDHHKDDYMGSHRHQSRREAHEQIADLLGDRMQSKGRGEAPSIAYMIEPGELVAKRFDMIIGAPADADFIVGAALRGCGLDPQRTNDPQGHERQTHIALALLDSKAGMEIEQIKLLERLTRERSPSRAPQDPFWLGDFRGGVKFFEGDPEGTRDIALALAQACKDGNLVGEDGGEVLAQIGTLIAERECVVRDIVANHLETTRVNVHIFDMEAARREFVPGGANSKIAREVLGLGEGRKLGQAEFMQACFALADQEIVSKHGLFAMKERDQQGRLVVHLQGTGMFARGREDGGFSISDLQNDGRIPAHVKKSLRGLIGHRVTVPADHFLTILPVIEDRLSAIGAAQRQRIQEADEREIRRMTRA